MYRGLRIAVIAPCWNEGDKILRVIRRVHAAGCADEMIVVDDGSSDGSPERAQNLGATVIRLGKTVGVGAALRRGFEQAQHFDVIVVLAGNDKDEPKEIPSLLDPIADGRADFVQGSRFLPGGGYGGEMPFYRRLATRLHPLLFSWVTGKKVTESTNGFRAFRPLILQDVRIHLHQAWLDHYELEPYLYYKILTLGYATAEVPVTKIYPPKKQGYTKMKPILDWWKMLKPLVVLPLGIRS